MFIHPMPWNGLSKGRTVIDRYPSSISGSLTSHWCRWLGPTKCVNNTARRLMRIAVVRVWVRVWVINYGGDDDGDDNDEQDEGLAW